MTRRWTIEVKGQRHAWAFEVTGTAADVEDWRADGLEVSELINTIPAGLPAWLTRWWVLAQDVFFLRWLRGRQA